MCVSVCMFVCEHRDMFNTCLPLQCVRNPHASPAPGSTYKACMFCKTVPQTHGSPVPGSWQQSNSQYFCPCKRVCVCVKERQRGLLCTIGKSLYFVAVMSIYVYTDLCRGTQTDVFSARRWCGSLSIKATGRSLYCAAHCSAGKPCLLVFTQV